ncbi:MAG TPA: methyltransferase domain-containing protein [Terriglobia bacterium]|nr:methyltransferase domain-containing protein [Terriglobia bacterium]
MSILHIAPEPTLQTWLERHSNHYVATDLARGLQADSFSNRLGVVCDLRRLPFHDFTFDLVIASHVLEHIKEDRPAIQEIYRVLASEGIALLPVPIVAGDLTIEYNQPHPHEQYHVRAPGLDYFDRYREAGFSVAVRSSGEFPEQYQIFAYEDRTKWPSAERPLLPKQAGARHKEYLPICQKRNVGLTKLTAEGSRGLEERERKSEGRTVASEPLR